jgi:hypothetical protein
MKINRKITLILMTAIALSLLMSFSIPFGSSEQTGTGQVTVGNSSPSITSLAISATGGGGNLSAIDPWTTYQFNVTVSDADYMADIKNVTITMLASATGFVGTEGSFNKTKSYGFQYYNNSGTITWYELGASGWASTQDYLTNSTCTYPSMSDTSGTWTFTLKLARTAHKETTWNMTAYAIDSAGSQATKTWQSFTVNQYISFTRGVDTITWTGNAGQNNITASSMPSNINIYANTVVKIQVKGDGDLQRQSGPPATIALDNVYVGQTASAGNNDGVKLTTSYQDLYTSIDNPDGANYATYWYLTIPDGQPSGIYTFTYYVEVAAA